MIICLKYKELKMSNSSNLQISKFFMNTKSKMSKRKSVLMKCKSMNLERKIRNYNLNLTKYIQAIRIQYSLLRSIKKDRMNQSKTLTI